MRRSTFAAGLCAGAAGLFAALLPGGSPSAQTVRQPAPQSASASSSGRAGDAPDAATELGVYWVSFSDTAALNKLVGSYDVLEARAGNEVAVVADRSDLTSMRRAGYGVRLDRALAPAAPIGGGADRGDGSTTQTYYGGYRTKVEQYAHLDAVVAANPTLAVGYDYGDSWRKTQGLGGSDLRVVCITKLAAGDCQLAPNSTKPRAMVMASIHARELTPAEVAYRYIDELIAGYNVNADITALLDSTEVWVIPVVNPDGREIVEQGGNAPYLQRKNANNTVGACSNPPTASNHAGVDLNRNASFQWGGVGTSALPCEQTYKGTSAASEPEQQALQTLWAQLWPDQHATPTDPVPTTATGTFLTLHSYSNFVLLPPGAGGTSANDAQLRALAFRLSNYNGYQTGTGPEILYGTTGTSDDWVYHELGPASFTFELGPTTGTCSGFTPAYSCVDSTFWPQNKDALIYASKSARSPYLTPRGPNTVSPTVGSVVQGSNATLTATINDGLYGNAAGSFGRPTVQNVTSAEYFVDVAPWAGGTAVPMSASDGSFSASSEAVTAQVPTGALSIGRHIVYVRGTNAAGFTGPVTAQWLNVTDPNATTTTTTVPPVTTLLTDNFEAGSAQWTPIAGSWSLVADGTQRYQGTSTTGTALSVAGQTTWTNYSIQATAKVTTRNQTNAGFGVFLRYQNTSNYYRLSWNRTSSRWEIVRVQGGVATVLAQSAVSSLALNTDTTIRGEAAGSTLRLLINGTVVATATDATFSSGRPGLSTATSTSRFDNVTVTSP